VRKKWEGDEIRQMLLTGREIYRTGLLLAHGHHQRKQKKAHRERMLRRLLTHAYAKVPFYRELFDKQQLRPWQVRMIEELSLIPITRKSDLRERPLSEILSHGTDERRLIRRETHGSTGEPFMVYRTWMEERLLQFVRRQAMSHIGIGAMDRSAKLMSVNRILSNDRNSFHRLAETLGLFQEIPIDCLLEPEEIAKILARTQPSVLIGYPGVLVEVAEVVRRRPTLAIAPKTIVTEGEILTPVVRRHISQTFKAPVYDSYGAHEMNLIAWECGVEPGYHLCEDSVIVEVLKDGRPAKPGESGEITCTALYSYTMPFIRYQLGDVVVVGEDRCRCGVSGQKLLEVKGRTIDYFRLPEGRLIHPFEIVDRGLYEEWIKQYQLVQEAKDKIRITLLTTRMPHRDEMLSVEKSLKDFLGKGIHFEIILASHIPREPGGKCVTYKSLVHPPYLNASSDLTT
jgi:phenylacetate-CoA ligase